VRLSLVLLVCSLLGVVGGAFLIGRWAVGVAVIFDSLCAGAWGVLLWDFREPAAPQAVRGALTLHDVLERARAS
jgi:hypothetical protein